MSTTTTPALATVTAASVDFEAARSVAVLPEGHRSRRLHGHGFQATAYAALPAGWATFPGGEVPSLMTALAEAVRPLDYAHLNDTLPVPTDENLARWISAQLDARGVPGVDRIAIQSTPHQGVDLDRAGRAHVWRRYRFQAAHRLPNVPLGHKCGRLHGHGFEAIVHANADLGSSDDLAIDYDHLDEIWSPLHLQLNYHCLNEIEGLDNPTSERLASWLWAQLQPVLPALSGVTVYETASCGAHFDGTQWRIWKDFTLDSAVQLKRAPAGHPAAAVHGHTYTLRLHLLAPLDALMGWTLDFGDVKALFDPIFKRLDHHPLHELAGLADGDTATLAAWVLSEARTVLPQLARVDLYEQRGSGSVVATAEAPGRFDWPLMPV